MTMTITNPAPAAAETPRLPIIDPATGCRRGEIRWPDGEPPPVEGCRRCGRLQVHHAVVPIAGGEDWHPYEEPTPAQVRARGVAWGRARIRRLVAEEMARLAAKAKADAEAEHEADDTAERGVWEPVLPPDAQPLQWGDLVPDTWGAPRT